MPDGFPVTITDDSGEEVEVDVCLGVTSALEVYMRTSPDGVLLSAAQREEFSRAYIAASWAAEGRVSSDG